MRRTLFMLNTIGIRLFLSVLLVLVLSFSVLTITKVEAAPIDQAKTLYEQGDYFGSLNLLSNATEEEMYLSWLNDRKIGELADVTSSKPSSPNNKYYVFVQSHATRFEYSESFGMYETSSYWLDKLKERNPNSNFVGEIEYIFTKEFDEAAWEDGDGTEDTKEIIADYNALKQKYPTAAFVQAIDARITKLKELYKNIVGSNP